MGIIRFPSDSPAEPQMPHFFTFVTNVKWGIKWKIEQSSGKKGSITQFSVNPSRCGNYIPTPIMLNPC